MHTGLREKSRARTSCPASPQCLCLCMLLSVRVLCICAHRRAYMCVLVDSSVFAHLKPARYYYLPIYLKSLPEVSLPHHHHHMLMVIQVKPGSRAVILVVLLFRCLRFCVSWRHHVWLSLALSSICIYLGPHQTNREPANSLVYTCCFRCLTTGFTASLPRTTYLYRMYVASRRTMRAIAMQTITCCKLTSVAPAPGSQNLILFSDLNRTDQLTL